MSESEPLEACDGAPPGSADANLSFLHCSVLMKKANTWLKSHPQWKVISCESIESKVKHPGGGDTTKSTYSVSGKYQTEYTRSLRLSYVAIVIM